MKHFYLSIIFTSFAVCSCETNIRDVKLMWQVRSAGASYIPQPMPSNISIIPTRANSASSNNQHVRPLSRLTHDRGPIEHSMPIAQAHERSRVASVEYNEQACAIKEVEPNDVRHKMSDAINIIKHCENAIRFSKLEKAMNLFDMALSRFGKMYNKLEIEINHAPEFYKKSTREYSKSSYYEKYNNFFVSLSGIKNIVLSSYTKDISEYMGSEDSYNNLMKKLNHETNIINQAIKNFLFLKHQSMEDYYKDRGSKKPLHTYISEKYLKYIRPLLNTFGIENIWLEDEHWQDDISDILKNFAILNDRINSPLSSECDIELLYVQINNLTDTVKYMQSLYPSDNLKNAYSNFVELLQKIDSIMQDDKNIKNIAQLRMQRALFMRTSESIKDIANTGEYMLFNQYSLSSCYQENKRTYIDTSTLQNRWEAFVILLSASDIFTENKTESYWQRCIAVGKNFIDKQHDNIQVLIGMSKLLDDCQKINDINSDQKNLIERIHKFLQEINSFSLSNQVPRSITYDNSIPNMSNFENHILELIEKFLIQKVYDIASHDPKYSVHPSKVKNFYVQRLSDVLPLNRICTEFDSIHSKHYEAFNLLCPSYLTSSVCKNLIQYCHRRKICATIEKIFTLGFVPIINPTDIYDKVVTRMASQDFVFEKHLLPTQVRNLIIMEELNNQRIGRDVQTVIESLGMQYFSCNMYGIVPLTAKQSNDKMCVCYMKCTYPQLYCALYILNIIKNLDESFRIAIPRLKIKIRPSSCNLSEIFSFIEKEIFVHYKHDLLNDIPLDPLNDIQILEIMILYINHITNTTDDKAFAAYKKYLHGQGERLYNESVHKTYDLIYGTFAPYTLDHMIWKPIERITTKKIIQYVINSLSKKPNWQPEIFMMILENSRMFHNPLVKKIFLSSLREESIILTKDECIFLKNILTLYINMSYYNLSVEDKKIFLQDMWEHINAYERTRTTAGNLPEQESFLKLLHKIEQSEQNGIIAILMSYAEFSTKGTCALRNMHIFNTLLEGEIMRVIKKNHTIIRTSLRVL